MTFNFDNQMLKDLKTCQAAFVVRHVHGLQGKEEKVAADVGKVYHEALPLHFQGENKAVVAQKFEEVYHNYFPIGQQPVEPRFELNNCLKIMERYCDTHPLERLPFIPIEFEQVRGVPLSDDGELMFYMKRDMLVQVKSTGIQAPLDHKTTGRITDYWLNKFKMSSQLSGYTWGTQQQTGQISGVCYVNAIEVAALPSSSKKCREHGVPFSECSAEHANFRLIEYIRRPETLEEWKRDAIILAKQARMLKMAYQDVRLLPQVPKTGRFDEQCRFCEFFKSCDLGFGMAALEEFTVYSPWEPWGEGV